MSKEYIVSCEVLLTSQPITADSAEEAIKLARKNFPKMESNLWDSEILGEYKTRRNSVTMSPGTSTIVHGEETHTNYTI